MNTEAFDPLNILSRLDWVENDDLEFKSAKGGLPKSLWETYSAMANASGGVILLGVEDNGVITGVNDVTKLKADFWNTLNNRGKVNLNLLSDDDVVPVEKNDAVILAIHIPRATRYQRPVFLGQNPLTGTYRRNYEGDYHCTEREVGRMLSDRAEEPVDSRILEHYGMEDLDQPSLQQYRHRFASFKPTHPWLSEDDLGFLIKLGGWRKDRSTGIEGITVAGLLMFGREEALREALPQYHVDYREKLSDDPDVRWTDRLMMDGTWSGNLFQFYLQVIQRLSADLKIPFQLDSDLFRKGETIVHEAIREALVNALIHADYQGMGGVVVEKYSDRFEFSNPGMLLVSMDQLLNGNVSECRNKTLQTMFTLLGAAEKAGSGVDKIRRGWESQHWRLPRVNEQMQPDRVMWMLPMVSLIPDESLQRLKNQFGAVIDCSSNLEIQAMVTADIEKRVDNRRLQQISGEHAADITNLFHALVAKKILVKKGHGRWSWYHLPEMTKSPDLFTEFAHNDDDFAHNDDDFAHKGDNFAHKGDNFAHNGSSSGNHLQHLQALAATAQQKQRLKPKAMESLILQLCKDDWLTKRELGQLLERNDDGLRFRYLKPMVVRDLLRIRYPEKPNRTDQAYRSISDHDGIDE